MKIRTAFVSNSSSSSFVFFGVKNPPNAPKFEWPDTVPDREDWNRLDQEYEEFRKKWGYLTIDSSNGSEQTLYGILISDERTGSSLPDMEISFPELLEIVRPLAEELGVSVEEFKLYIGERST